jgi:hypothetical protein
MFFAIDSRLPIARSEMTKDQRIARALRRS